jgi:hypothetical protein
MSSIYVFYHICCKSGIEEIVRDQLTKITFSGLYDRATTIYCCLVGAPMADLLHICNVINQYGSKFIILDKSEHDTTYERFTLTKIKDIVTPEDKFLYSHKTLVTPRVAIKTGSDLAGYTHETWIKGALYGRHKSFRSAQLCQTKIA